MQTSDLVKVSIICTCYNQADYIEDALKGFVGQKTSFPYEVIVHDDASTDGTQMIVQEYAERYPNLIKPILQTENQMSKGRKFLPQIINSVAKGRYIARCEGDDYWIDSSKLQKQFEFLENNIEYSACLSNSIVVDYTNDITYLSEPNYGDCDKKLDRLILEGGGLKNPTASLFYRKELCSYVHAGWNAPVGDHFILMELGSHGCIRWFSDPAVVYRYGARSSFTTRHREENMDGMRQFTDRYVRALLKEKAWLGEVCAKEIDRRIAFQRESFELMEKVDRFCAAESCDISILRGLPVAKVSQAICKRIFPEAIFRHVAKYAIALSKYRQGTLLHLKADDPKEIQLD